MFDLWFKNYSPNKPYAAEVEETFKKGGYYKIDINDDISILPINTIYFNNKQTRETDENTAIANEHMEWLENLILDETFCRK